MNLNKEETLFFVSSVIVELVFSSFNNLTQFLMQSKTAPFFSAKALVSH